MSDSKVISVNFNGKDCDILPFESPVSPALMPDYVKMDISSSRKGEISAFCQQIPELANAYAASGTYIVKWHDGLPHEMTTYKNFGGYMPATRDPETGKIVQWAELYPNTTQAVLSAGFAAMSIATSQYYLAEINHQMKMMNQSLDRILEFLYGDKKAELLAEISFAKYAHQNFSAIMEYPEQRIATIQSLQEGKKTAIKDIEFYLSDLYSTVHSTDERDVENLVHWAFQIRECLKLSAQLYVMGNVLEVYYSGNFDESYLQYVKDDASNYISKCNGQILGDFMVLRQVVDSAKPKLGQKINKPPLLASIDSTVDQLNTGADPELKKALDRALYSPKGASEYCITANGEVYMKKNA